MYTNRKIITAIFDTRISAEAAILKLEHAGFTEKEISLLVSEDARNKYFDVNETSKVGAGAATGAAVGGVTGAIFLALASAGTLLVPGLNLVVSGALISGLVGLGAGAATGGLVGSLVGLGLPESEAKLYEESVKKGSLLIAVEASDEASTSRIESILKDANAQNITSRAA